MNRIFRRASLVAATAAAATGLALPTSAAHADPPLPCPRIFGVVCTWTEVDGQGELRLLREADSRILPPVRSAQNQALQPWCFFDQPDFRGEPRREIAPWQTIRDLGFWAFSARPGGCFEG